jgi:tRNA dimethylallyltransferase
VDRPTAGRQDPVPVLLGPTAVGKTAVGVEVARRLGGEILSADSRAFFVGLDIVTDKPPEQERRGIPHHLIDCVPIAGSYDAMAFRRDVERLIPEIRARGRIPILVGGGTLYLGAVLRGIFEGPAKDGALRSAMAERSVGELYDRLVSVDPAAVRTIHPNDRLRITRALEVHRLTGRPISEWQAHAAPLPYSFFMVGLRRDRDDHRTAIMTRVRRMIDRGLVDEVRRLRERGLGPECQAYRTIGVPEAVAHIDGRASEIEMEQEIVSRTWGLVRRQSAWFRREKGVSWWDVTGRNAGEVADEIVAAWTQFLEAGDDRR